MAAVGSSVQMATTVGSIQVEAAVCLVQISTTVGSVQVAATGCPIQMATTGALDQV